MSQMKQTSSATAILEASTEDLLLEIQSRGGHPAALARAALLCLKKSQDYNHGEFTNPHHVDRSEYFPFGVVSYAQMIHTKSARFNSLTRKRLDYLDHQGANFEGLVDTALDIINYAGFYIAAEEQGL